MILGLVFFILTALLGFVLLRWHQQFTKLEEQLIWAAPFGLVLTSTVCFLIALLVGNLTLATGLTGLLTVGVVAYYFAADQHHKAIKADWRQLRQRFDRGEVAAWLVVLVPWLIYTVITVPGLLYYKNGDLVAGWINVWGDWAVHLRNSTFLAQHQNLTLDHPLFTGIQFHYPYISSYISALLQRFGVDMVDSLIWPTYILFGSLPLLLFTVGRHITENRKAGVLFTYIFLLAGGLGLLYLIQDLAAGKYFWDAPAHSPMLYTDLFRNDGDNNQAIWFMNFIMSEFLPQRAFLTGLPIALYILLSAWQAFTQLKSANSNSRRLLFTGLLFGLLPIIHTHSFIALGLIVPLLWLYQYLSQQPLKLSGAIRPALWVLLPATVIGFTLLFFLVFDLGKGQSFLSPMHWWVPKPEESVNPLIFWARNAGPLLVLGGIAAFFHQPRYASLIVIGLIIFVITNFINFQPWNYDNLKIMTYWYLLWSLPVASLLASAKLKQIWVVGIALILLCGAGLADSLAVTASTKTGLGLANKDGLAFAQTVQQSTTEQSVIAAATNSYHDHPVSLASGRKLYLGYEGWLWSYGIDGGQRARDLEQMYQATEAGVALLKERGITHLVLGPQEQERFKPNRERLLELFPVVREIGAHQLLQVK